VKPHQAVAESNHRVPHMLQILNAAAGEAAGLLSPAPALSSGRLRDLEVHRADSKGGWMRRTFEHGTWGGELRAGFEPQTGEIVSRSIGGQREDDN